VQLLFELGSELLLFVCAKFTIDLDGGLVNKRCSYRVVFDRAAGGEKGGKGKNGKKVQELPGGFFRRYDHNLNKSQPMLSKKEIKDIQSLAHKKFRAPLKLFIAEGPKIVGELWNLVPEQFVHVYAVSGWDRPPGLQEGTSFTEVTEQELERISQLQTPHQVLAVLRQTEVPDAGDFPFYLYLDGIQDPGNFGTIIRIADWFGVPGVVCGPGCADIYNPKVVQSTMASIARVRVFYDVEDNWLENQDRPVFAATLGGSPLPGQPKTSRGVLMIGNESKGLRPSLIGRATERITIPRKGEAESLNAAVATGIILSHLLS
jgi:TrmH family RNA methyltransferase